MSESRRQLTLFDCGGPFSKRSRVEHATPSSSLNVTDADVTTAAVISHVQSVHADILSDDDSSVLTINDLVVQPPTPRCSTPVFIDSSSDEASFSATFSPCKDPSPSNDNSQHLTISMANSCNSMLRSIEFSFPYTSVSTITSVTCPTHSTCSSTMTDSASTHLQPHSLSQTGLFYTAAGHGATVSEVSMTNTTVACSYSVPSQPSDIAQISAFPPVRPVNIKFPTTPFGNTSRTFNPIWYDRFDWLEYSVKCDACFCYPCRMFGFTSGSSTGKSRPEPVFTSSGFRDWKHATGKSGVLTRHSNCFSHKQAELAWGQYKMNSKRGTTIAERMGSARSLTISQNRHYIKQLLKSYCFVAGKKLLCVATGNLMNH